VEKTSDFLRIVFAIVFFLYEQERRKKKVPDASC